MLNDLSKILFSETEILECVAKLGAKITADYKAMGVDEITIVCITNGSIVFTADLMRKIDMHLQLDCIRISSYQESTEAVTKPQILDSYRMDLKGKHVLLVDDILDTGNTLYKLKEMLLAENPASVKSCVLLNKQERRSIDIEAEYVGLQIPDEFVIGYGLDFAERYRNLPCIGILKTELQPN